MEVGTGTSSDGYRRAQHVVSASPRKVLRAEPSHEGSRDGFLAATGESWSASLDLPAGGIPIWSLKTEREALRL